MILILLPNIIVLYLALNITDVIEMQKTIFEIIIISSTISFIHVVSMYMHHTQYTLLIYMFAQILSINKLIKNIF